METSQLAIEPVEAPAEMSLKPQAAAMEAIEDVTYGSIAGIVGKYIEYPFDTVKVRLQSQPDHLPLRYTGPLDCFRQSLKADGIGGLYRGITAPLVGAAAENSCLFMFESVGREAMFSIGWASRRDGLSLPQLYLTGAFAGAFASLALTPIELVKCKIQAPAGGAPSGQQAALRPVAVIRSIFRHGGIMGFWHGQMGTLIRETGGSAAWFGAKETTTALFREQRLKSVTSQAEREALATTPLPFWQQAIAGASAGIAYNFLFFPADTIKSRMQTMPLGGSHVKRTFWSEGVAVWKQHGLKGMYRGCGITCLRSAPSSAFIFMVYDGLKRHLPMH